MGGDRVLNLFLLKYFHIKYKKKKTKKAVWNIH